MTLTLTLTRHNNVINAIETTVYALFYELVTFTLPNMFEPLLIVTV